MKPDSHSINTARYVMSQHILSIVHFQVKLIIFVEKLITQTGYVAVACSRPTRTDYTQSILVFVG